MKRAIRDIYNKDIDEVIVEGDEGYRQAKEFMKLLMPSHARRVKQYSDPVPLFQRAGVEDQLSAMYHPVVQLKSGGYLVINPTEALVSIDINSGRSTREHNIEQTATATNLEAAQEIARQLRLRDMAGLVVIDFIDMDNGSNVRKVEKAMKEALKNDRARIQVGRISSFGLMEMSRQRLRTGVLEASTRACPHCEGTGLVRTASSAGLSALRLIEDEAARGRGSLLTLRASLEAAFYVLNRKRADIAEIEDRYGVRVEILPDGETEGARMAVEALGPPPPTRPSSMRWSRTTKKNDIDEDEIERKSRTRPTTGMTAARTRGASGATTKARRPQAPPPPSRPPRPLSRPEGEKGATTRATPMPEATPARIARPTLRGDAADERRQPSGADGGAVVAGAASVVRATPASAASDTPRGDAGEAGEVIAEMPIRSGRDRNADRSRSRHCSEDAPPAARQGGRGSGCGERDRGDRADARVDRTRARSGSSGQAEAVAQQEGRARRRGRTRTRRPAEAAPAAQPARRSRAGRCEEGRCSGCRRTRCGDGRRTRGRRRRPGRRGCGRPSEAQDDNAEPRRGWWQRTFGA